MATSELNPKTIIELAEAQIITEDAKRDKERTEREEKQGLRDTQRQELIKKTVAKHEALVSAIKPIEKLLLPILAGIRDSRFPEAAILEEDHYRLSYPSDYDTKGYAQDHIRAWIITGRNSLNLMDGSLVTFLARGASIPYTGLRRIFNPSITIGIGFHKIGKEDLATGSPWDWRYRLAGGETTTYVTPRQGDQVIKLFKNDGSPLIYFDPIAGSRHFEDPILGSFEAHGVTIRDDEIKNRPQKLANAFTKVLSGVIRHTRSQK